MNVKPSTTIWIEWILQKLVIQRSFWRNRTFTEKVLTLIPLLWEERHHWAPNNSQGESKYAFHNSGKRWTYHNGPFLGSSWLFATFRHDRKIPLEYVETIAFVYIDVCLDFFNWPCSKINGQHYCRIILDIKKWLTKHIVSKMLLLRQAPSLLVKLRPQFVKSKNRCHWLD